ncbi:trigger factor [Gemmatimonadota bacterium]
MSNTSTWLRSIEVEIPRERIEAEEKRILNTFRKKAKVDGFRQGKVPEHIIEQRYGQEIRAEAIDSVLPEIFTSALEENEIRPLAPPLVENLEYAEEGPMKVTATVEVMPEFEVKGYKGLKLEKTIRPVLEADIEGAIEELRERTAELVPVDRPAAMGDFLIADINECDDAGTPIIGQKSEGRTLFIPEEGDGSEVGRQLLGASKGEDRRISVERPVEGSGAPALPTASAVERKVFLVQVKEIKEKRRAELDDEYARSIGDFDSLADLRAKIEEDLREHFNEESRRMMVGQAIDALIKKNTLEVPESLTKRYLEGVIADHQNQAGDQPVNEEAIRQQYRGIAQMQMQWQMIQARIAEQEEIEIAEEEVRERVVKFAEGYQMDPDEAWNTMAQQGRLDGVRADIREEKVIEMIIDSAKVKEKKASPQKVEKALQKAAEAAEEHSPSREESMLVGQGSTSEQERDSSGPDDEPGGGGGLIIPGR